MLGSPVTIASGYFGWLKVSHVSWDNRGCKRVVERIYSIREFFYTRIFIKRDRIICIYRQMYIYIYGDNIYMYIYINTTHTERACDTHDRWTKYKKT